MYSIGCVRACERVFSSRVSARSMLGPRTYHEVSIRMTQHELSPPFLPLLLVLHVQFVDLRLDHL